MFTFILKPLIILFLLFFITLKAFAQVQVDTFAVDKTDSLSPDKENRLNYKALIIPAVFISYGVVAMNNDYLRELNFSTRDEILEDKPTRLIWDNYTQYVPAAMVYGLNAFGVKGKHNFKDRTIVYLTSQLISTSFVVPLKYIVREERPDKSDHLSFPSGHTSTAFSSAQFMFREYQDTNILLSLSGYPFALFTGIYRSVNNKHWVGDVVAGAGFGILSTELAYWLLPKMDNWFKSGSSKNSTMIAPFYRNNSLGLVFVKTL